MYIEIFIYLFFRFNAEYCCIPIVGKKYRSISKKRYNKNSSSLIERSCLKVCDSLKVRRLAFSAQLCLVFTSKNSKAPPPASARALSMWRLAVELWAQRTREQNQHDATQKARPTKRPGVTVEPCPPEAAGEESAVPDVVPDQPQGHGRVLDVAVGEQQQVPHPARRRQQAEGLQGAPQLRAAPSWTQTLTGGREEEKRRIVTTQTDFFLFL